MNRMTGSTRSRVSSGLALRLGAHVCVAIATTGTYRRDRDEHQVVGEHKVAMAQDLHVAVVGLYLAHDVKGPQPQDRGGCGQTVR